MMPEDFSGLRSGSREYRPRDIERVMRGWVLPAVFPGLAQGPRVMRQDHPLHVKPDAKRLFLAGASLVDVVLCLMATFSLCAGIDGSVPIRIALTLVLLMPIVQLRVVVVMFVKAIGFKKRARLAMKVSPGHDAARARPMPSAGR